VTSALSFRSFSSKEPVAVALGAGGRAGVLGEGAILAQGLGLSCGRSGLHWILLGLGLGFGFDTSRRTRNVRVGADRAPSVQK
jgi:hypothetical protein